MSHPPRLKNFSYTGQYRHFLTFCSEHRAPILIKEPVFRLFCAQLRTCCDAHGMAADAYCVMPDHVHLLTRAASATAKLQSFMKNLKQQTGWGFRKDFGGRLWQRDYYDHVLREDDEDAAVIAYIVNNPLRAGLVKSPLDYPFWGSLTWTREQILDFIGGIREWKPSRGRP